MFVEKTCFDAEKKPLDFEEIGSEWQDHLPLYLSLSQIIEVLGLSRHIVVERLVKHPQISHEIIESIPRYHIDAACLAIVESGEIAPYPEEPKPEVAFSGEDGTGLIPINLEPLEIELQIEKQDPELYVFNELQVGVYVVSIAQSGGSIQQIFDDMAKDPDLKYGLEGQVSNFFFDDSPHMIGMLRILYDELFIEYARKHIPNMVNVTKSHKLGKLMRKANDVLAKQRRNYLVHRTSLSKDPLCRGLIEYYKRER
ncbi:MAG: hypothetical protein V1740_05840 [Candidatus Woesearchaeota archaeon]